MSFHALPIFSTALQMIERRRTSRGRLQLYRTDNIVSRAQAFELAGSIPYTDSVKPEWKALPAMSASEKRGRRKMKFVWKRMGFQRYLTTTCHSIEVQMKQHTDRAFLRLLLRSLFPSSTPRRNLPHLHHRINRIIRPQTPRIQPGTSIQLRLIRILRNRFTRTHTVPHSNYHKPQQLNTTQEPKI